MVDGSICDSAFTLRTCKLDRVGILPRFGVSAAVGNLKIHFCVKSIRISFDYTQFHTIQLKIKLPGGW